jgi:hypothetical protein
MPDRSTLRYRLETGSGMRLQRGVEAGLLVTAFVTGDLGWAYATFVSTLLQAVSPWLAPLAVAAALVERRARIHAVGDLYFDLSGSRGACAISVVVQGTALLLVHHGFATAGWLLLAVPTASFVLSPTVGFCAGCTCYVWLRDSLSRAGRRSSLNGIHDFDIDAITPDRE